MVYYVLIMCLLCPLISSCAQPTQGIAKTRLTLSDIYFDSRSEAKRDLAKYIEKNLRDNKTFGYVKPYIPVVQGPVVRKVWIPDHQAMNDVDVLVGGHWVYLMIEGPKWFIERKEIDNE